MSFYEDLDNMMAAIRLRSEEQDYGSLARDGSRTLIGPYRIPAEEWDSLTEAAGLMGAPWYDRYSQNAVVKHQLTRLYNKYGGKWDATAVAWEAGEAIADRVAAGESIDLVVKGDGVQRLSSFVADVAPATSDPMYDSATQAITGSPLANAGMNQTEEPVKQVTQRPDAGSVITNVLTTLRDKQVAAGGGMPDGDVEEGQ